MFNCNETITGFFFYFPDPAAPPSVDSAGALRAGARRVHTVEVAPCTSAAAAAVPSTARERERSMMMAVLCSVCILFLYFT